MLSLLLSTDHQLGYPLAMAMGGAVMSARGMQNFFNGHLKIGITQIAVGTLSILWGTTQLNQLNNESVSGQLDHIRSQADRVDHCRETTFEEIKAACRKSYCSEYDTRYLRRYASEIRAESEVKKLI
jgi:hypothetical protein